MPDKDLRDRDAIVSRENLIFRVFGYSHPHDAYVCDAEYAPSTVFSSQDPRALRKNEKQTFYKFYDDEGWRFIQEKYPRHMFLNRMLGKSVIGIRYENMLAVRRPNIELQRLMARDVKDQLVLTTSHVLGYLTKRSTLIQADFGVFGSLLHGFHNPQFSDIDLVIYGREKSRNLYSILHELYHSSRSSFRNEFESGFTSSRKQWKFVNLTLKEYILHQCRKPMYGVYKNPEINRPIKIEFEPVKDRKEIVNEYDAETRILQKGWTSMTARITSDEESAFLPSIYEMEPLEILQGPSQAIESSRIVSYLEEFRMQASTDEVVHLEGNLEEVKGPNSVFYQVALTYCPRYYEQVLKRNDLH